MPTKLPQAVNARHANALASFAERLEEIDMFHAGMGKVHRTLSALARDLDAHGIEYAIVGGMALNAHGYHRETVDVDVLVTPDGLASFREKLVGRGYRPAFEGAERSFRNAETNVQVEFLTSGQYPGDGKPKPVSFPAPKDVSIERDGCRIIGLPALITLKLASGMTNPGRLKDLADVQELIRKLDLDESMATQLHPYVRDRFVELMDGVRGDTRDEE